MMVLLELLLVMLRIRSESSLASGGNGKGLLAVDYVTGRAAAQKKIRVSAFESGHKKGQIVLDFRDSTVLLPAVNEELERVYVSNDVPLKCLDVGRATTYEDICFGLSKEPKSVCKHGKCNYVNFLSKVYRLDSVAHKRKRSSVQTPVRKRRITNQCVPGHIALPKDIESSHAITKGFVSQKRKHSSIQRQCGERLITDQCVTSHPTVTDDVGSNNAQIKGLAAFHPEPNIFLQSSWLTESSSRIWDPFDQRRVFANKEACLCQHKEKVQMHLAGKYGKEFMAAATELMTEHGVSRQVKSSVEF
nr:hypothetical protein [Tanacetum cinerariifolium]